jgi:hypothetical protein
MKKTITTSTKRSKLALKTETVRTLTSQDLSLVVGGECKHGSVRTMTVPVKLAFDTPAQIQRDDIPTCN